MSSTIFQKIKEDPFFSDENIIEYIKKFYRTVRPGSQTQLNSIVPLLQITDNMPGNKVIGNKAQQVKSKQITESANFEIVPPDL